MLQRRGSFSQGGNQASRASVMAQQLCSPPMLFFDCPNGFRGCCAVNPCIQSEPFCPCSAQVTGTAVPAVQTSLLQSVGFAATSEASSTSATKVVETQTHVELTSLSAAASTGIFVSTLPTSPTRVSAFTTARSQSLPLASSSTTTPSLLGAPAGSVTSASSAKTGPIVGGLFGGLAGLAGIIGLAYWCVRQGRRRFKFEPKTKKVVEDRHMQLSIVEQANITPTSAITVSSNRIASPTLSPRGSPRIGVPITRRGLAL